MKLKNTKIHSIAIASLLLLVNSAWANDSVASASASGGSINFSPIVSSTIVLEITNGFQFAYREVFKDSAPSFSSTQDSATLIDGQYNYQLTTSVDGNGSTVRQSGTFEVVSGNITLDDNSVEE